MAGERLARNDPKRATEPTPETGGSIWLRVFRDALHGKNPDTILSCLIGLQSIVQGATLRDMLRVQASEVRELLDTGETTVYVGGGTNGQRIFIDTKRGIISMNFDETHSGQFARNFRNFFDLPEEDLELQVRM